jgi:hypothetical protein
MTDLDYSTRTTTDPTSAPSQTVGSDRNLKPIACLYCWEPIPAESFSYWSPAKRVLCVMCPCCDRRVILSTATWRLWSGFTTR